MNTPLAVLTGLLGLRLLWSYLIPALRSIFTDFPNYYTAAWAVRHGSPLDRLYDPLWFQAETERAGIRGIAALFNYFTPISALIMWPLAGMPALWAKQAWTLLNVGVLGIIVVLVARHTRMGWLRVTGIALLATDALGNNFLFGQFYLVLTLLLLASVLFSTTRPSLAGFCLAFASAVKLFPAVFVVYFVIRRQWAAVFWSGVWLIVLTGISIWVLGWETHRVFLTEVLPRALRGEIQDPYNVGWNTLQALLRRSLVPEPGLNPEPLVNAPWAYFFVRPVVVLTIMALSFAALGRPFAADPFKAWSILIAMISLVTPSQASYHYVLLIPGIAGLLSAPSFPRRAAARAAGGLSDNHPGAARHPSLERRGLLYFFIFALVCSNLTTLVPFARAYLMIAFWLGLMWAAKPRVPAVVFIGIVIFSGVSGYFELRRWNLDTVDAASMAFPEERGYMEVEPRFVSGNLVYKSLGATGFVTRSIPAGQPGSSESRSPDGRYIAYATNDLGNWDIAVRELATGTVRVVTSSAANDTMPVFSPDGLRIFFASDRRRGYRFSAIFEMKLE